MDDLYTLAFEITGKKIQKSGFRSAIEEIALELEITGSAKNKEQKDETGLTRYSVDVVAEGTKENLQTFIQRISEINTFHMVNSIERGKLEFAKRNDSDQRNYPVFAIERGGDHVGERMDEAAYYMKSMSKDMGEMSGDMKGMRTDMQSMDATMGEMSGDMKEMGNETKIMRKETHENFQTMETKYHNISNKLNLFVDIVAEYIKSEKPELRDTVDALQKQYKE